MPRLYLDIESIPTQRDDLKDEIRQGISPPGNFSKPESIQKWMDENAEAEFNKKWRETSFDGSRGEIVCICWALDDDEPVGVHRGLGGREDVLLTTLYGMLATQLGQRHITEWIGHYISGFDLRFIWQRSVIHGVKPSVHIPYDSAPWKGDIFDTKVAWTGMGKSTGSGSLDHLCRIMGFEGKGELDGSKVWDYVRDGRIAEVFEYCKDDVRRARFLHKQMTFAA